MTMTLFSTYALIVWLGAAAAGPTLSPPPLAGFTAPVDMTTAPAFWICLVTEAINSSQLLAKEAILVPLECSRPLRCPSRPA